MTAKKIRKPAPKKAPAKKAPTDTKAAAEAAFAALQQEQLAREEACMKALPEFLKKYECEVVPRIILTGGQVQANVVVRTAQG